MGNANEPHFQEWIPALQKVGLEIHFISFVTPRNPIPKVVYHLLPYKGSLKWTTFVFGDIKPLQQLLHSLQPQAMIASNATNYGILAQRVDFHPCLVQTWTWDLTILPQEGFSRWIFRYFVKKVLHYADVITTDGTALQKMGEHIFPQEAHKMVATTWGIRVDDFLDDSLSGNIMRQNYGIPQDAQVFTWARGLAHIYQPNHVLPQLWTFLKTHEDTWGIILGLGHHMDKSLTALLDECEKHPRIIVIRERLLKNEMKGIWEMSDFILSMPIADGISEALLEGMLCNAIPIVNAIPSNHAIVAEGNGLFVKNFCDLEDVFLKAHQLSPQLRQGMQARNKAWVLAHAAQEKTAQQMKGLLVEIIQKNAQ